ncbi:MAG: hypothetical protein RR086_00355 [Clostridia bacterium]
MKNKIIAIALAFAMALCIVTLCACGEQVALTGKVTVVIDNGEGAKEDATVYVVDLAEGSFTTKSSIFDVIEYLGSKKEGALTYKGTFSGSEYGVGAYISEIGALKPTGNEYIAFFMSNIEKKDVSAYALADRVYEGKTIYYSGYGVSGIKLMDGLVAYFVIATY